MTLLRSKTLGAAGLLHAFPERGATDLDLARELGLPAGAAIVQVKQIHGGDAIDAADVTTDRGADALVARASGGPVAVGVRVADCVPVLVADEASGDVAAIHAGWRGIVAGVVRVGVERLGAGRPPGAPRLVAAIGPCIGPCCFEVGRDVAEQIGLASHGARVVAAERGDKAYVDLRAAVRAQLVAAGMSDGRIEDVPGCTKHETARFHSFRRDGGNSGRMLAAIAARRST
ncbi:MAG TPA: polyphenol oxidase family protein [Polyangiaceae bacterium]|nr:polyphenol oxidase family protein [Polyangiaceae bacterium]